MTVIDNKGAPSGQSPDKLSIALCTFNGAKFLAAQLDSFRAQTRLPDELIVCDDRSTDATPEIVASFARQAPFSVRLVRNDANLGAMKNFEQALRHCDGTWVFFADQDDVWLPGKLKVFATAMKARPEVKFWAGDATVVDADLKPRGDRLWASLRFTPALRREFESDRGARLIAVQNKITGATCAVHADLKSLVVPFPPVWFHDAWIALLAAASAPCGLIPDPLILYRQHGAQQVGAAPLTIAKQIALARRMDADYFKRQKIFFEAALERLASVNVPLRDPGLLDYLRDKIQFCESRRAMRTRNRLVRSAMVFGQALRGRYHRHAQGFRAVAADALL